MPSPLRIGRHSVRLLGRTGLGTCGITPTAGNPRCNDDHRREQRDEQEDPCRHDPHLNNNSTQRVLVV